MTDDDTHFGPKYLLKAKVSAIPILVENATGKESIDGWNAYLGIHRCILGFAEGLSDETMAKVAYQGFQQFDEGKLKSYLLESREKFKGISGYDVQPLFTLAAKNGTEPEHRQLAADVLRWLSDHDEQAKK